MAVLMVALCFSACGGNDAKVVVAEAGSTGEEKITGVIDDSADETVKVITTYIDARRK